MGNAVQKEFEDYLKANNATITYEGSEAVITPDTSHIDRKNYDTDEEYMEAFHKETIRLTVMFRDKMNQLLADT